ncbi:MAG: hypothetical protein NC131_18620 [Roseburia sp.]|nr:hypothetical protein [Roseburia sp.]
MKFLLDEAKLARNAKLAEKIARELKEIERERKNRDCKPCVPPDGTKLCLKALPCTRIRGAHKGDKIGHVKMWKVNQSPDCQCHTNFVRTLENTLELPSNCLEIFSHPDKNTVKGGGKL